MIDDDRTPQEIEYARVMQEPFEPDEDPLEGWNHAKAIRDAFDREDRLHGVVRRQELEGTWPAIEPSENPGYLEPIPCSNHGVHSEHVWESTRWGSVECLGVGGPDQCSLGVPNAYGSAPERCALPSGHEGVCKP